MDDELKLLEAELERLRPAAPSRRLELRIERALAPVARRSSWAWWFWRAVVPAAAVVVVVVLVSRRVPAPGPSSSATAATDQIDVLKPVAVENVLYATRDEGLVTLDDGSPARRQRLEYVDTITWKNTRTNASLTWSVPREEVRVVPVLFQ